MATIQRILGALMIASMSIASAHAESDADALRRLEAEWNEARLARKPEVLEKLWADELTIFVPRMEPMSKKETLAFWSNVPVSFSRYESSVFTTKVLGTTAITTGKVIRAREFGGKAMQDTWFFTKVYAKQGTIWRVISYPASEAPQP